MIMIYMNNTETEMEQWGQSPFVPFLFYNRKPYEASKVATQLEVKINC